MSAFRNRLHEAQHIMRLAQKYFPDLRSGFGRSALVAVGFCVLVGMQSPAGAQTSDLDNLGPRLDQLLSEGKVDEARALLRENLGTDMESGLHVAHFEGVILMRQQRYAEAIEVFRQILNIEPNFTPSRVELARALYATGQTSAAAFHFGAINLGADDVGLKRLAQGYLEMIASNKPYGFNGYFGLVPSTNVNRGTQNETITSAFGTGVIAPQSREISGIGFAAGVSGYRNVQFGDGGSGLSLAGAIDVKKYLLGTVYDEAAFSTSISFTQKWRNNSFRIGPMADVTLAAWNPALVRYGLSGGVALQVGPSTGLTVSVALMRQDNLTQNFRDGWLASVSTGVRHMLSPSLSFGVGVGGLFERTDATPDLDHNDLWIRFHADKEWSGGLLTSFHLKYENHTYLDSFSTFFGFPDPRVDNRVAVGGNIAHRKLSWMGFAPQLTWEFTRQFSNIAFYDYTSFDVGLNVTRNF